MVKLIYTPEHHLFPWARVSRPPSRIEAKQVRLPWLAIAGFAG